MKFLADMGVSLRVVAWLRGDAHDVIHLRDEKLERLADIAIFEKARTENRIILTFDLDFGEIVAQLRGQIVSSRLVVPTTKAGLPNSWYNC